MRDRSEGESGLGDEESRAKNGTDSLLDGIRPLLLKVEIPNVSVGW